MPDDAATSDGRAAGDGAGGRAGLPQLRATLATMRRVWRHPSNDGQRLRRVGATLRVQLRHRLARRPTVVRYLDRSRVEVHLDGCTSKRAAYYARPDPAEMAVWSAHLGPGDRFVDVGANIGLYSLLALEQGAEVIAVEPGAEARRQLVRNLALNGAAAEVVPAALADHAGNAVLRGPDPARYAIAPVVASDGDDAAGGAADDHLVEVRTLDDVLGDRRAAGVKIDVEGAERLVLEGAARALAARRIALLQLEWNDTSLATLGEDREPVAALLDAAGYELLRPGSDGRLRPVDGPGLGRDCFARPRP